MIKSFIHLSIFSILLLFGCKTEAPSDAEHLAKNTEVKILGTGDDTSIALADNVMEANGGAAAWNATRYIQWNFFGSRKHIWDKKTNDLIIESLKDKYLIKLNLANNEGSVLYNGIQHTEPDSLAKYIEKGKQMWNNDSYWLLLPYKLRDPGVDLKYLGKGTFEDRDDIDKIEMTYTAVGDTPNNKYHIYIHPESHRIIQWEFFPDASDEKPRFATPWTEYKQYGNIWLAGSRGENYALTDLMVDTPELEAAFKK